MNNTYVKLTVVGLTYSQTQSAAYALVLGEEEGQRRLPIIIGSSEAQSIAMHLQGVKASRPLTHDLFVMALSAFGIKLRSVVIYKMEKDIFYSELFFEGTGGNPLHLDSRTSDAVALAVRAGCPIYTTVDIMDKAGVVFDDEKGRTVKNEKPADEKPEDISGNKVEYSEVDDEELQVLLNRAIKQEDYEHATLIRDEMKRRSEKK
jgi:uncharacterized protein